MEKNIIEQYNDIKARVNCLKQSVSGLEKRIREMDKQGYYVADTVSLGKKGKRTLGNVTISGFPNSYYQRIKTTLKKRMEILDREERELEKVTADTEEYIAGIGDVEMRNLISLHCVEDLNWVQVAHRMNGLYKRKKSYTENSCRRKYERFFEKNKKTTVLTDIQ